jgi:RHS repeat-associated protein
VYRGAALLADAAAAHHYTLDHLGTPRIVSDNAAHVVARHTYYPFGVEITDNTPTEARLKFTGHERDADLLGTPTAELDYMHARYYANDIGRFLSVDPYLDGEKSMRNPQMWNRYAYVTNNPLRYTDPTGKSLWETLVRVVRYIGKEEKVVARVKAISKSKAMEGIERGIKVAREEKATSIAVVTESKQARNAVGKQLSESGKIRPPERSGVWPEHVNPADGPNSDIHVQTIDTTKSAGFGKSLGVGLLAIIGANTMAANANADATPGEITSAFLWDSAKAIDPIFLTDAIEHVTGVDAYAEENPPE